MFFISKHKTVHIVVHQYRNQLVPFQFKKPVQY